MPIGARPSSSPLAGGFSTRSTSIPSTGRWALRLELVAVEKDRERLEEERRRIAAELEVEALEASGVAGEGGQVADEIVALAARRERAAQIVAERRHELANRQQGLAAWRERY